MTFSSIVEKKLSSLLLLISLSVILILPLFAEAYVSVKGYYRKDGTYVRPHVRSNPNGIKYDNYSYRPSQGRYNKTYGTRGSYWDTPTYLTDPDYYEGQDLYERGLPGTSSVRTSYSSPSSYTYTPTTTSGVSDHTTPTYTPSLFATRPVDAFTSTRLSIENSPYESLRQFKIERSVLNRISYNTHLSCEALFPISDIRRETCTSYRKLDKPSAWTVIDHHLHEKSSEEPSKAKRNNPIYRDQTASAATTVSAEDLSQQIRELLEIIADLQRQIENQTTPSSTI